MRNRIPALVWLLAVSALLIAALGVYLKYVLLRPLELYQDEYAVAVPFLLLTRDENSDIFLHGSRETEPEETVPETSLPDVLETEAPTEMPTDAPTEPVQIDESWFNDALFIGDSRTEGLSVYGRLGEAHYFCKVGMSVYNVQKAWCSDKEFGKTNLSGLLSTHSYGKVYINLGLNEVGYDHAQVLEKYAKLVDLVREKQPDAVIILQGIMTVSRAKAKSKQYFSLENIDDLNQGIEAIANGEQIRYIDVNEWIADEEGYLPDDLSNDGCHLQGAGYSDWSDWIMENAATLGIE